MPIYKDSNNQLHSLDSSDYEHLLPADCVEISDAEAEEIRAAAILPPSSDEVRGQRDALLLACDWTVLPDTPLSTDQQAAWKAYRKALRDITKQAGFPTLIDWPVKP